MTNISMGGGNLFIDSNYFIALFNKKDAKYNEAIELARDLETNHYQKFISNLVFSEVVTVISQRVDKQASIDVGEYLLSNTALKTLFIDDRLHQDSWNIFKEISSKNTSFVDCGTIAVMRAENIQELLTFDVADFKKLQKGHRFKLYKI